MRAMSKTVGAKSTETTASASTLFTDDDALAYVVPIARRIASTGTLRVWADQARSMWPPSQPVLLAVVLRLGGDRLHGVAVAH